MFSKFFFDPKFSKNLYFWLFLARNSINLVSLKRSKDIGMYAVAQIDLKIILLNWVKKVSKFLPQKFKKSNRFKIVQNVS